MSLRHPLHPMPRYLSLQPWPSSVQNVANVCVSCCLGGPLEAHVYWVKSKYGGKVRGLEAFFARQSHYVIEIKRSKI